MGAKLVGGGVSAESQKVESPKSLYKVSESWKGVKLVGGSASSVGYWAGAG